MSVAESLGLPIVKGSPQYAHQADGCSPLNVIGETRISLTRDDREFQFEGLVVENLDAGILGGVPFMKSNDIAVRPATKEVILADGKIYTYGACHNTSKYHSIRRTVVLRAPPKPTTVWPGKFIELECPQDICDHDNIVALEPRTDTAAATALQSQMWPAPGLVRCISGRIRIPNLSSEPKVLKKNEHFCQACAVFIPPDSPIAAQPPNKPMNSNVGAKHTLDVKLDPDNILPMDMKT